MLSTTAPLAAGYATILAFEKYGNRKEDKSAVALSIDRRTSGAANNGVPSSGESTRLPSQT